MQENPACCFMSLKQQCHKIFYNFFILKTPPGPSYEQVKTISFSRRYPWKSCFRGYNLGGEIMECIWDPFLGTFVIKEVENLTGWSFQYQ